MTTATRAPSFDMVLCIFLPKKLVSKKMTLMTDDEWEQFWQKHESITIRHEEGPKSLNDKKMKQFVKDNAVRYVRCGKCLKCLQTKDCGKCVNCLDKRKFFGPSKRKQGCIEKKCQHKVLSSVSLRNNTADHLDKDSCAPNVLPGRVLPLVSLGNQIADCLSKDNCLGVPVVLPGRVLPPPCQKC